MSLSAVRRLAVNAVRCDGLVNSGRFFVRPQSEREFCSGLKDERSFDLSLLQVLVCPLSKKPLRYDEKTNELINEELGIAYPIIDGIPNMIPQEARLLKKTEGTEEPAQS